MLSPNNPGPGEIRDAESGEQRKPFSLLIKDQAKALEESCEKGSLRDTLIAASWHKWNLFLGITSAVIAAFAAFARTNIVAILQQWGATESNANTYGSEFISFLVLLSAILTSILTFLSPSEKSSAYHHFSNKLRSLRDRVRSFMEIDCLRSKKEAALCEKFDSLVREKSEIDSSHPIVPNWAYKKAYKVLKEKHAQQGALQRIRETPVNSILAT
jgi:hypothetical protein